MKSHQFQSITEEQWKSGLSRHRCALCAYDYDDPVHSVSNWPLVLVIEDCFVPESAPMVVKDVGRFDEFMCGLFIHLMVIKADNKLWDQRN